ncbi:thioredoxin-like protein [Crepidotus variabilis]|uniref:Thioredoxin-like protein n=1 Tax=Crepidotus variabilis TaxID=179855 RepID=A0A9P6EM28_9AGAR|nr:thioredoxin-like protein [Crepidotus variabilis]
MYADIEALVLSGELFNGPSRSSSPTRSASPTSDPGWHDEELVASKRQEYNEKGLDYDSDTARRDALSEKRLQEANAANSIGMGPGRTGVKGVIRDRDEANHLERNKKAKEVDEVRKKMEAANLGGKTYLEEEREKAARGTGEKVDLLVRQEQEKVTSVRRGLFGQKEGRFGHLREVGLKGFLPAVEEEKGVWVVVHLYDASLERCYIIDERLSRLAREFPDTKFLRARASVLGFASTSTSTKPKPKQNHKSALARLKTPREEDEDDPYGNDNEEEDAEEEMDADDDVDLDMLPTMLVYRDGDLVHNWVRVDWEAGDAGLDELLDRQVFFFDNYPCLLFTDTDTDTMYSRMLDDERTSALGVMNLTLILRSAMRSEPEA